MNKLKIERITNVDMPKKAHISDAGFDFYLPYDLNYIVKNGKNINIGLYTSDFQITGESISQAAIEIKPHESVLLPMGIRTEIPEGYALVLFNRSGIATKKHLFRGACVVDRGYTGELLLNLVNTSNSTQYLLPGEKVIQALLLPVPEVEVVEGKIDTNTERGTGGFGSTGN